MTNQTRSLRVETHDGPDNNELSSSARVDLHKCRDTAQEPDLVLNSTDVSDPDLYQQDIWQPLFARLRREARGWRELLEGAGIASARCGCATMQTRVPVKRTRPFLCRPIIVALDSANDGASND